MFVRQLSYLVALARERHFGRAAETCSVSQPALSAAIRNMEDELGMPIVQRRGRSFEGFTPEGERLLGWARQILADWSHLRQEASGARATAWRQPVFQPKSVVMTAPAVPGS